MSNKSPALSIAICTYNRAFELKKVLDDIFIQYINLKKNIPNLNEEVELVVVDNNSNDNTQEMIFEMIANKTNQDLELKYLLETQQGSSPARNRAIQDAKGNLIAFLDDDILLEDNWLYSVYKIAATRPSALAYGTRVIPLWENDMPDWLSLEPPYEVIQSCFPAHDYGDKEKAYPFELSELTDPGLQIDEPLDPSLEIKLVDKAEKFMDRFKRRIQNPISACFLCSKDVFENHGNFRTDLGIQGDKRGACEDTEFFWRLAAAGIKVIYQPAVRIYHPIPNRRMSKGFVLDWYKLLGKTLQYIQVKGLNHLNPGSKAPTKLSLTLKLIAFTLMFLISLIFIDPIKSFWFRCQIAKTKGQLEA